MYTYAYLPTRLPTYLHARIPAMYRIVYTVCIYIYIYVYCSPVPDRNRKPCCGGVGLLSLGLLTHQQQVL